MRFEGSLNVDLNEITMNLVPFPRMHFLLPSVSPLYMLADVSTHTDAKGFVYLFIYLIFYLFVYLFVQNILNF